jgi:type IV pilus assembly protein PilQ
VARVVVDLTTATPYQVSRDGEAVVISFETPSPTPLQPVSSVTTLTSRQNEKTRPEFNYVAASPRVAVARSSKTLKPSAPRFALPSELTQPSVTLASFSGKEPVRPDSSTQQAAAQQAVQQAGSAAATMAQAPAAAAPAGKYTGEPISVNLKDVDLKDFFRLIHEISGLNVVLDPAVKGTLTIVLDEVPWDQALDIVMQNNSLDKQLNGNVLRIATRASRSELCQGRFDGPAPEKVPQLTRRHPVR